MFKKILCSLTMLSIFVGLRAFAITECPATPISEVQVTDTNVVVKRGNQWHLVGAYTDPGIKEKLSTLLSAHVTGRNVILKFTSDSYNCNLETYSSRVYAVRVLDN